MERDYNYPQMDTPGYAKLRESEVKDRKAVKSQKKPKKKKTKDMYGNTIIVNKPSAFEK